MIGAQSIWENGDELSNCFLGRRWLDCSLPCALRLRTQRPDHMAVGNISGELHVRFVPIADRSRCSKTDGLTPLKMPFAGRKLLAGFLDAARPRVWVFCRVYPTDEVASLVRRKLFPLRLRF